MNPLEASPPIQNGLYKNSPARVLKQLLEALLFEGVIAYHYRDGHFYFRLGTNECRARGTISAFSRVRLDADNIWYTSHRQLKPVTLPQVIAAIPASETSRQRLFDELQQTITLCQWNDGQTPQFNDRRQLAYRDLEAAIDEGHPYHPCFKARSGFSLEDHARYGPEQANHFQLHWLAIHRDLLKQRLPTVSENSAIDNDFWQRELGSDTLSLLRQRLQRTIASGQNYSHEQAYGLMPIHPWQWQKLQNQLQQPLHTGELIDLGVAGDFYQASISVRTLLNVSAPDKANIKLPLSIVNSSSVRTIEPHSICTAPLLSAWLEKLAAADPFYQQQSPLGLLAEYAGVTLCESAGDAAHWTHQLSGQLGVIFRQSLEQQYDPTRTLPFVALAVTEADGHPFIEPWIKQYGCQAWVEQLIKVVVIPVWHLLVKHGIALEAHAQNMLLVHNNGWPEKLVLRDFHESLEYVESYLAQPQLAPDFLPLEACYRSAAPNQYYWMESIEALRELLVDTLFVFNLADLAVLLEQQYQYPEREFWQQVQDQLRRYERSGHCSPRRLQQMDLTQPRIYTESLITKKLCPEVDQEFHHAISNPLAQNQSGNSLTEAGAIVPSPLADRETESH